MHKSLILSAVITALIATQSVAAPIAIDDFSDPVAASAWVISLMSPDPSSVTTASGSVIGGEREVTIDVIGAPGAVSATGTVGGGTLLSGSQGTRPVVTSLLYDGVGTGTASPVDVSTYTSLVLDFNFVDGAGAGSLSIDVTAGSAGGTSSFSGAIASSAAPFSYIIPLASFVPAGAFDATAVTSLSIVFNSVLSPNVDFELDNIQVVPEPASLTLAALGLCGLGLLRRRRS